MNHVKWLCYHNRYYCLRKAILRCVVVELFAFDVNGFALVARSAVRIAWWWAIFMVFFGLIAHKIDEIYTANTSMDTFLYSLFVLQEPHFGNFPKRWLSKLIWTSPPFRSLGVPKHSQLKIDFHHHTKNKEIFVSVQFNLAFMGSFF